MSSSSARFASAPSATSSHRPLPFARRRLRLGITGVGSSVLLATALLLAVWQAWLPLDASWRWQAAGGDVASSVFVLTVAWYLIHAVLLLPVEHAGGRRAIRQIPPLSSWMGSWLRGVLVLALLSATSMAAVISAGIAGGTRTAVLTTVGVSMLVLTAQGLLARWVNRLPVRSLPAALNDEVKNAGLDARDIRVVEAADEAFVGGWLGSLRPTLWIPARWTGSDMQTLRRVQWVRRGVQLRSGARMRGWLAAVLWPALGLWLSVSLLPFGWDDARLWVSLPAMSTVWSFVAVLLLPTMSRPAVYHADAEAARVVGVEDTARVISQLDQWQDDEPERTALVESIFHPVPSAGNRVRRLHDDATAENRGGHQQTRLTLLSSLVTGSVLGRVVHCNIGRPALWVVYPGD
jgi:hypothetical protein